MKEIYFAIGLPGVGKTTYLMNVTAFRKKTYLNADFIRQEFLGQMMNRSQERRVWMTYLARLAQALRSDTESSDTIVLDTGFLNPKRRKLYLDLIKKYCKNFHVNIYEFPMDLNLSSVRQKTRQRQIPESVIQKKSTIYVPFSSTEMEGLNFTYHNVISDEVLPNQQVSVKIQDIANFADLESQLFELGIWREGEEWYSAMAAIITLPHELLAKHAETPSICNTINYLCKRGFACIENDSQEE